MFMFRQGYLYVMTKKSLKLGQGWNKHFAQYQVGKPPKKKFKKIIIMAVHLMPPPPLQYLFLFPSLIREEVKINL